MRAVLALPPRSVVALVCLTVVVAFAGKMVRYGSDRPQRAAHLLEQVTRNLPGDGWQITRPRAYSENLNLAAVLVQGPDCRQGVWVLAMARAPEVERFAAIEFGARLTYWTAAAAPRGFDRLILATAPAANEKSCSLKLSGFQLQVVNPQPA